MIGNKESVYIGEWEEENARLGGKRKVVVMMVIGSQEVCMFEKFVGRRLWEKKKRKQKNIYINKE